jgi:hypothetical protein
MSAPLDPESIPREVRDGVIASVIGAFSMAARLMLSEEKHSWSWVARRVAVASLVACLSGYVLMDYISSPGLRMGAIGALAYSSPEALDAGLRWIKARAEREVEKVSKSKPNGKAKRSKRK